MLDFASVPATGSAPAAAMVPYCLAPAATGVIPPLRLSLRTSTLARSSTVIFNVGLSSMFVIVSFLRGSLLQRRDLRRSGWSTPCLRRKPDLGSGPRLRPRRHQASGREHGGWGHPRILPRRVHA